MNALTLCSTAIRQLDGLYSLNDLHVASGNEAKHKPANFMRLDTTVALIEEIRCSDLSIIPSKTITGKGKAQGTYVCKELVYAYAMWISAKFHLAVIRAFDALHGQPAAPASRVYPDAVMKALNRRAHALNLSHYDRVRANLLERCAALPDVNPAALITAIERMELEPDPTAALGALAGSATARAGQRFLVQFRDDGQTYVAQPVPSDCVVMTTRQFLKALIDRNGLTVHPDDTPLLFDAVERLQGIIRARCRPLTSPNSKTPTSHFTSQE